MIPSSHVLLIALIQFGIGLVGVLVRRAGVVVLVSALIMLNGILLAVCAVLTGPDGASSQTAGVVILACMVALALTGVAILYRFHRFRRAVALDEHDRMRR